VDRPADFSGAGAPLSDFNPYISPASNQVNSMRELLTTRMFLTAVAARVDGTNEVSPYRLATLGSRVLIWPGGEHVVNVQAKAASAEEAAKIAQAVIDEFGAVFARQLKETATREAEFFKEQVALTKADYDKASTDLQALLRLRPALATAAVRPGNVTDPEYGRLLVAHETALGQYDKMVDRYAAAQIAATSASAISVYFAVIDRPEVPSFPVAPGKKALLAKPMTGILAGVLASAGIFLLSWRLDRKVRYPTDLAFAGNDVVILSLPTLRARRRRWPASFVRLATAINGGIRSLSMRPQTDAADGGS
jgi:capsular polysaccharide biosynthesis protein